MTEAWDSVDPIYYQVNQTRLTENTQKSSDNLRLQSNKEAKRKAERAGEVDKSAMATDSSAMSEDMLGDMDPDDYGGSGAKHFAQMWREQQEEERKRREHPEEDPEEEEENLAAESQESEVEAEAAAWSEMVEGEWVDLQAPSASHPEGGALAVPPSVNEANEAVAESKPGGEPGPSPAPSAAASPPLAQEVSPKVSPERVEVVPPAPRSEETAAIPQPESSASVQGVKGSGAFSSLLDFGQGFLIAEEAQWSEQEALPGVAAEEIHHVPDELSVLLDRLVTGDSTSSSYRKLQSLLARFGRHALQVCSDLEVRVYLLPPQERLLSHPQLAHAETDLEGAAYLPGQRLCLVEEGCLSQAPTGFHPVFFYMAQAFDHALGGEVFASLKSPAVQASYLACLEGAHRFGDLLAAHSPAHYFAQAVESYLAENDCFEPLWTRQDLYDFDRSMYEYIEYLLKMK